MAPGTCGSLSPEEADGDRADCTQTSSRTRVEDRDPDEESDRHQPADEVIGRLGAWLGPVGAFSFIGLFITPKNEL